MADLSEKSAEEGLLVEGSESNTSAPSVVEPQPWRFRRHLLGLGVGLLVAGCVGLALSRPTHHLHEGQVDQEVELDATGAFDFMSSMAEGMHQMADLTDQVKTSYHKMENISRTFKDQSGEFSAIGAKLKEAFTAGPEMQKKLREKFRSLNETQKIRVKEKLFHMFGISSLKDLKPKANLFDGNPCQSDEEENLGLCYKKCSLLTDGAYPYRVNAWECCKHEGECPYDYKVNLKICGGYGVSGDTIGGGCPHTEGGCLLTEELYGNTCYMRCSLLSYKMLSFRGGPNTCCNSKKAAGDVLAFMDTLGCQTDQKYFKGGGMASGEAQPTAPHLPDPSWTES